MCIGLPISAISQPAPAACQCAYNIGDRDDSYAAMPPLRDALVADFLRKGFLGIEPPPGAEAELAAMGRSYDSLFSGHMDGATTGHQGLVPDRRASAAWPEGEHGGEHGKFSSNFSDVRPGGTAN